MNKFDIYTLSKKEVLLYPKMKAFYEKCYDSFSKRVWQEMDESYEEIKKEIQWCLERPKEIHVQIDFLYDRLKTIGQCNYSLKNYIADCLFDLSQESTSKKDRKIIQTNLINFRLEMALNRDEVKYLKQMIDSLKEERDIIQNHYHPLLKRLKEDLRQEKYEAFEEAVLRDLHMDKVLNSDIDKLKEELKKFSLKNIVKGDK